MKSYVWPVVAALSVSVASGQAPSDAQVLKNGELERGTPAGKPVCIMKIDMGDFGGQVLRFGDLNGDQRADVIAVQSHRQIITCITALDLDGKILWQRGKADKKRWWLTSDVAVQIYDWDNDGRNEVIVIENMTLLILDGATGEVKQEQTMPSNDSLIIGNFTGGPRPNDLVIKDRYENIWLYDKDLKPLWNKTVNTGHLPMPIDVDGDGRDELLCGYTLFDSDGTVLWDHQEDFKDHNDAVDADDMDGDGKIEFAIACSGRARLLSADGTVLWTKNLGHAQHAVIGKFDAEKPGKQAAFVDRSPPRSDRRGEGGEVYYFDIAGNELHKTSAQGWLTIISTIDGWTGEPDTSHLLVFRRKFGPPVMLDGAGKIVAEFPFPVVDYDIEKKGLYNQTFVQHFDAVGDSREEVFVYNHKELWVYQNQTPAPANLPDPQRQADTRIYNASFYTGWQ